ncbi:thiamine kinase-like enzyme [Alkalihalobacillus xiaoxiensis]|uniref:Thiamine kinase-like enzyme n=1 Tax=Shouchella xiaoxiensis TaxID=766895 RepID=A0ABS2SSB3_9BACI|nr:thiamine kinase-like enzyme [Shouchella xiaoxiensis]
MKMVELFLGEGWDVLPAGGSTGEAYIARQGDYQLFIKRNSSPFLAVLSAEGIVPKLLWTKRLESGDVITAQRWIQGRELKAKEMKDTSTAKMLAHIHGSSELLDMFTRMGNEPLNPAIMVENMFMQVSLYAIDDTLITEGLSFLEKTMNRLENVQYVVCHGDMNHNNWMHDEQENLYLIDWDGATVADPALDLGLLLYSYIPEERWADWLSYYGVALTTSLRVRMHWYVVAYTISEMLWNQNRKKYEQVQEYRERLSYLLNSSSCPR